MTARSSASARTTAAGVRAATPACSTSPTRSSARGARSRTRTPATCSSRRRRARVHRPRRPQPSRRRQPRLAARGRLGGADAGGRARAAVPRADRRPRAARRSSTSASRARCRCSLTARRAAASGWSSASSAAAASPTSACSPRWSACRGSCSSPSRERSRAYEDAALPIGARPDDLPAVHGRADLRGARVREGERVLDVGTGSGYQAAVLAELGAEVAHDRADPGARRAARARTSRRPATSASRSTSATARSALPEHAPFDAIAVAAAAPELPASLYEQLEPGRPARRPGRRAARRSSSSSSSAAPRARRSSTRCPAGSSRSSARRASPGDAWCACESWHEGVSRASSSGPRRGRGRSRSASRAGSRTCRDGSVEAAFEGDEERVESMVGWCRARTCRRTGARSFEVVRRGARPGRTASGSGSRRLLGSRADGLLARCLALANPCRPRAAPAAELGPAAKFCRRRRERLRVNLAVYTALLQGAGLHYLAAASAPSSSR